MASIIVPVGNDRRRLMGISRNMELNPAITAAAIISGAYIGDTSSYGCHAAGRAFCKGPAVADVNDK
ncbi:MAG: hypothetical protein WAK37_12090 [Pseudolabrys sp.]